MSGSPGRSLIRTFRIVFKLPQSKGELKIAQKIKGVVTSKSSLKIVSPIKINLSES